MSKNTEEPGSFETLNPELLNFNLTNTPGATMAQTVLKLYVSGGSLRTKNAIANLESICRERFGSDYDLTIIDVFKTPQLAEDKKIFATPTLVCEEPLPVRCIIGDMSERDKVLLFLEE